MDASFPDQLSRKHFLCVDLCFQSYAELFQQTHQVVEELPFDDLAVLPVSNSAELQLELLVCGRDRAPIRAVNGPMFLPVHLATEHL